MDVTPGEAEQVKEITSSLTPDSKEKTERILEKELEEAGKALVGVSETYSAGDKVKNAIEGGMEPYRAFMMTGMKTRKFVEEDLNSSIYLDDGAVEEIGWRLAESVDDSRKSSLEKYAEKLDPVTMIGDFAISGVKSAISNENMIEISRSRRSGPDSPIYGAKPERCVESFRMGYQQQSGSFSVNVEDYSNRSQPDSD